MPLHHVRLLALLAFMLVAVLGSRIGDSSRERNISSLSKFPDGAKGGSLAGDPHPSPSVRPAAGLPAPALAPPNAIFTPGVVAKSTGTDGVALTFDDGPSEYTMPILDLLRANGVKATFCLIGELVREHPDLVQAIVRDGHTLCNHSWMHDFDLGQRSDEEIRSDLQRTNDEIRKAVPGASIRYFRHPGGMWTPAAIAIAQELGMTSIHWDTDPLDWDTPEYTVGPTMTSHIIDVVKADVQPGSIVLSHDGGGDRTSTIEAYRTLLPYLLDRGLRLVALPPGERFQQSARQPGPQPR
jgi:peptidoglycan/xylan/chitin deacetylase (PgdA/CDA1 family)